MIHLFAELYVFNNSIWAKFSFESETWEQITVHVHKGTEN